MSKQIQIDYELFLDICDYFYSDTAPEGYEADEIRKQIDKKIEKIINRELFTRYKRAPTGAEREKARQAYLDQRGFTSGYRTAEEWHMEEPPEEKS